MLQPLKSLCSNQQWIYVHRWKDFSQYTPHKVGQLWSKIIFICRAKTME
jgi:hypothetical protein